MYLPPGSPALQPVPVSRRRLALATLALALAALLAPALPAGAQPLADYGDAPDDTADPSLTAYPGVAGRFPTLRDTFHAAVPGNRGAHHLRINEEWLAAAGVPGATTTAETEAQVLLGDQDDARIEIYCVLPAPPAPGPGPVPPPPPPVCHVLLDSVHVGDTAPGEPRYLNVLVDADRNGRWASATPFGTFPREHVVVNREMRVPAGESRMVASGPFVLPVVGPSVWVRATLSDAPFPLDADGDGIPDEGWDGSVVPGGLAFGETEDHLVTPIAVPPGDPPKEPASHFRLRVVPNPVLAAAPPAPPATFRVEIVRTRPPGSFTPVTGYGLEISGCLTEGVGGGIDIDGPAGFGPPIRNDRGVMQNALPPGLPAPPGGCALPPCVDQQAVFAASYPAPADSRVTTCRVSLKVDPDGEVLEYDDPFTTELPVRLLEPGVVDNDGDGVPALTDGCTNPRLGPERLEDFDGYGDDDGCRDPDNDGDGVADESDVCPLDREDADGFEDGDGCPDPKTARIALRGPARGGAVTVIFDGEGGLCTVEIATQPGETAAGVAARLAAAIAADPCFGGQGVRASVDGDVLLVTGIELDGTSVRAEILDPGLDPAVPLCDLDVVPAATVLVPYFEVDLDDPFGLTTLVSINNAGPEARLAHVILWTDWAVPSLVFDVYLTGFDIVPINLRDILISGRLPSTGAGVSNRGELSGPNAGFPGCNGGTEPGAAPVYDTPALDPLTRSHLQAWHTGAMSPLSGDCGGADLGDNVARGYLTIDVADACSSLTPADQGYFLPGGAGVAGLDNALFAEYFLVHPGQNFAQAEQAVHIRAAEGAFAPGDYTFYGRYVGGDARDARQPLGRVFASRYLTGGVFSGGTDLLVWRDTKVPAAEAVACGSLPPWAPLTEGRTLVLDEDENPSLLEPSARFPWATQKVSVGGPALPVEPRVGRLHLDLDHATGPLFGDAAQGWVTALMSAEGRFSVGLRAVTLESACTAAAPVVAAGGR